ncbi:hypothetical protein B0H21DRAFT_352892 [Amylocystis lapponica]|nr:hypothetical protein B0H21DRAFT_352892 [Amylocystis lapponica]
MRFVDLPTDILFAVFRQLFVCDILAVRQTCTALHSVSRERTVWFNALSAHVLATGFPLPGLRGRSLVSLSSEQLEHLTLQALRLHHNWTTANPVCSRQFDLHPPSLPISRPRNIAVYFLPGHANRWLITNTLYDQPASPRKYVIQCWDLASQVPSCIAILRAMNLNAMPVAVNSHPDNLAVLALTRREQSETITTSIYAVDFSSSDPESAFQCINEFPSYPHSIALEGSTFVASDPYNTVRLIDIKSGQPLCELRVPLLHDDPTLRNEEHRCLGAVLLDHHVLVFRKQWIHLYDTHSTRPPEPHPAAHTPPRLDPIAKHKWQWRIDTLVLSPRTRTHTRTPAPLPPIDVLIRFDTWFPWPVNILHHFVLPPNPHPHPHPPRPAPPYLHSSAPADGPHMAHAIPAPVRLFTPSDVVLGRYGTALWIDAQTDPRAPAQAGDHGQRVVGQMLADAPAPAPAQLGSEAGAGGCGGRR